MQHVPVDDQQLVTLIVTLPCLPRYVVVAATASCLVKDDTRPDRASTVGRFGLAGEMSGA